LVQGLTALLERAFLERALLVLAIVEVFEVVTLVEVLVAGVL
jgi:hypothetical protein